MSDRRPLAEFPLDLICPACAAGPFKTDSGLRGHAHSKHKIKWEMKPPSVKTKAGKALSSLRDAREETDPLKLKAWHRLAIAQHVAYDYSYDEIAAKFGRTSEYIGKIGRSPAGKKFAADLEAMMEDPVAVLKLVLAQSSLGLHEDQMAALQWAKENKDYNSVHRIVEALWNRVPELREADAKAAPQEIHLHLGANALTVPEVKTSFERVEDEPPALLAEVLSLGYEEDSAKFLASVDSTST